MNPPSAKRFQLDRIYQILILCFVASLCIFHGKVIGLGFIRNIPSDFLAWQYFLADIVLGASFIFLIIRGKYVSWSVTLIVLAAYLIWIILPRGTNYNFYSELRILECIITFYLFLHVENRVRIYKLFSILGSLESIIAVIQFHLKHSIGLHFLGEPIFNVSSIGIAKIDLSNGMKVVRAYGTFSHPNSLGAFLIICFAFTTWLIFTQKRITPYCISLFLIIIGITTTFSRGALAVEIILAIGIGLTTIIYHVVNTKRFWAFVGAFVAGILVSFVSYGTYLSTRATFEDNSTTLRIQYDQEGVQITKHYWFFGVGEGNVIHAMDAIIPADQPAWMIQPPHNYLIIVSDETGLVGLGLFLAFIAIILYKYIGQIKALREAGDSSAEKIIMFWLLISILLLMQFDHYFYDVPLMALMFWMTLGIISKVATEDKTLGPMVQW